MRVPLLEPSDRIASASTAPAVTQGCRRWVLGLRASLAAALYSAPPHSAAVTRGCCGLLCFTHRQMGDPHRSSNTWLLRSAVFRHRRMGSSGLYSASSNTWLLAPAPETASIFGCSLVPCGTLLQAVTQGRLRSAVSSNQTDEACVYGGSHRSAVGDSSPPGSTRVVQRGPGREGGRKRGGQWIAVAVVDCLSAESLYRCDVFGPRQRQWL